MKDGHYCELNNWREVYVQNGAYHRLDGPAIIYEDGDQFWYKKGKLHREDGPAKIWNNGQTEWFKKGKLHREDGPAVIRPDGSHEWWLDDQEYNEVLQRIEVQRMKRYRQIQNDVQCGVL